MLRHIIYAVVALSVIPASAQPRRTVYPPALDASAINAISNPSGRSSADNGIMAIIEFSDSADPLEVAARFNGLRLNTITGNLASAIVPGNILLPLASDPDIRSVSAGSDVRIMTDEARHLSGVDPLHAGYGASSLPYTGKGVIIGIIDSGFDFQHPAFFDADGNCRICTVWDQNRIYANTGTPSSFGYGFILSTPQEIATAAHDMSGDTHGTHVAAIAASSSDIYGGMAPDAEIALVSTNRTETGIIDGLNYLLDYSVQQGKPLAVNISMGTVIGFKDGSDRLAAMIDRILAGATGQLVAIAAGNEGHRRSTIIKDHTSGSQSAIATRLIPPSYGRENLFAGASAGAEFTLSIRLKEASGNKIFSLDIPSSTGSERYDNLTGDSADGSYIAVSSATNSNGAKSVSVNLYAPLADGQYWEAEISGDNARYILTADYGELTDGSETSTIACTACGQEPLSVGAYVSRTAYTNLDGTDCSNGWEYGKEYPLSGKGPTFDGRKKPDVLAPGASVISAINSYASTFSVNRQDLIFSRPDNRISGRTNYWGVMNGTSMATPVATGIIALWLQANPGLTAAEMHDIVAETEKMDASAGMDMILAGIDYIGAESGYGYIYNPADRTLSIAGNPAASVELFTIDGQKAWSAADCQSATLPRLSRPAILRIVFDNGSIRTAKIM